MSLCVYDLLTFRPAGPFDAVYVAGSLHPAALSVGRRVPGVVEAALLRR